MNFNHVFYQVASILATSLHMPHALSSQKGSEYQALLIFATPPPTGSNRPQTDCHRLLMRDIQATVLLKAAGWPPHAIEIELESQAGLCPERIGFLNLCSKARQCLCFPRLMRKTYQFDERQAIGIDWLSNRGTVIALLASE